MPENFVPIHSARTLEVPGRVVPEVTKMLFPVQPPGMLRDGKEGVVEPANTLRRNALLLPSDPEALKHPEAARLGRVGADTPHPEVS